MSQSPALPSAATETLMFGEAAEAGAAVRRQLAGNATILRDLAAELRARPPAFVLTCARGSSAQACILARYAIETRLGIVSAPVAPAVGSVYGASPRMRGALFLAVSQSGRSPDLLREAEAARAAGARVVALVNVADSPLAELADAVVPVHAGPEHSVAATKSFLATLAAIVDLVAHWAGDAALHDGLRQMPELLEAAFRLDWSALVADLPEARDIFVLGRGYGLAAAGEVALKFKETCSLHAEAFSSAEVHHGPMALAGPELRVLAIGQDDPTLPGVRDTLHAFRDRGARVWSAAPGETGPFALPLVTAPQPLLAPLLAVQAFYPAINALALARGCNPDAPPWLQKVTETI